MNSLKELKKAFDKAYEEGSTNRVKNEQALGLSWSDGAWDKGLTGMSDGKDEERYQEKFLGGGETIK